MPTIKSTTQAPKNPAPKKIPKASTTAKDTKLKAPVTVKVKAGKGKKITPIKVSKAPDIPTEYSTRMLPGKPIQ